MHGSHTVSYSKWLQVHPCPGVAAALMSSLALGFYVLYTLLGTRIPVSCHCTSLSQLGRAEWAALKAQSMGEQGRKEEPGRRFGSRTSTPERKRERLMKEQEVLRALHHQKLYSGAASGPQ